MNYLEEAQLEVKETMAKFRYKIDELELEEYYAVNDILEDTLKQIPSGEKLKYNGVDCTFIEVDTSAKIFRIFINNSTKVLSYDDLMKLSMR